MLPFNALSETRPQYTVESLNILSPGPKAFETPTLDPICPSYVQQVYREW